MTKTIDMTRMLNHKTMNTKQTVETLAPEKSVGACRLERGRYRRVKAAGLGAARDRGERPALFDHAGHLPAVATRIAGGPGCNPLII
jgi:hypothetical protein